MQDENLHSTIPDGLPVWVNDSHSLWSTLRIAQAVSLGRLEWKWRSRGALLRDSSTSVRISFHLSNSVSNALPTLSENPCDWFRNPYVFIYVTSTEELNHIDEDVSSGWRRIRDFVDRCREKSYEYLFIMAATEAEVTKHKRVVDKLRTEINLVSRGPERLIILTPAFSPELAKPIANLQHSPGHQELLLKLRESLSTGVDARIMAYDDIITRSFLSRSNASWTFSKFYVLKEGLAFVFLHLGRRDLCLKLYDELQKVMNDLDMVDINRFCDKPAADIAMGSTNPDAKDYRSIMLKGTVTELDLRTYLFARQTTLLLHDRKFSEIAERGLKFITVVARRCAEEALAGNRDVSGVFRDTWVFVTSRLLSSVLAPSIPSVTEAEHSLSAQLSTPRERHTARLVAGFHVNALKAFQGLAHVVLPGCLSPVSSEKSLKELEKLAKEAMATSSLKLQSALSSPENAQILHSEIANAAASLYEMGGRARGAAALDGDAGIVRLKNKNYAEAETLLSAQCSRYTNDNGWDDLHKRQRVELAIVEKALDKVQEYLVSCLSILYMHRESRMISHRPIFQESKVISEQVKFWAAETKRAAALLPRVMKYKAERLFDVSVLPNRRKWYEGDPGTATVRVKSDIPVAVSIDNVMLECRCVDARESRRPSLRSREDELDHQASEDPSLSTTERELFHTESSSWNPDLSDVVVLKRSGETLLNPGANDIEVSVDEIPRAGCYKVTLISLFLGNLKLVQAASKTQSQPIVIVKDDDIPSQTVMTPPISEVINGEVKYPPIFAAPRLPSASLEFVHVPRFFLLGNALQYLEVKVKAGINGVQQGSKLSCTLHDFTRRRLHSKSLFVHFAKKAVTASSSSCREIFVDCHRKVEESSDFLGIDIQNALEAEEELHLRFGLEQLVYEHGCEEQIEGKKERVRRCALLATYICSEGGDQEHRTFSCQVEVPLVFAPILDVSARLERRSECYEEDGSRRSGYDDNTAEDGGTLLCSVQSLLGLDEEASVTNVSLSTPHWLEQRREDPSLQSRLIPSVLRGSSVFVCSFDLLVRDFLVVEDDDIDNAPTSVEDLNLRKGFLRRRLPRKMFKSPDISESQDDFGDWGAGGEQSSAEKDNATIEGLDFADSMNKIDKESVSSHTGNELEKVEQDSHGTLSTEETLELKEARDVVDLSTPGEESQGAPSGMLTPPVLPQDLPMSATTATLRIDLKISGIDGDAYIEQKISLAALRVFRKRYRIERHLTSETESGKPVSLKFAVLSVFGRFSGEDEKHEVVVLHYEIDADPSVWLVVGRRRGQMIISDVMTGKGTTTMIPLRCGRHRVPSLRLYTSDGRGLPLSTYENVDEYMQTVIRPCRAVVSCCTSGKKTDMASEEKGDRSGSRGTMPEVVASDSFFES